MLMNLGKCVYCRQLLNHKINLKFEWILSLGIEDTVTLSVHFHSHFPREPGLAGVY